MDHQPIYNDCHKYEALNRLLTGYQGKEKVSKNKMCTKPYMKGLKLGRPWPHKACTVPDQAAQTSAIDFFYNYLA